MHTTGSESKKPCQKRTFFMSEKKFIRTADELEIRLHKLVNEYGLDEKFIPSRRTCQRIWKKLPKDPEGVSVDSVDRMIKDSWHWRGEKEAAAGLGYDVRQVRRLKQDAADGTKGLLFDRLPGARKEYYSQNSADVWFERHASQTWKRDKTPGGFTDASGGTNEDLKR